MTQFGLFARRLAARYEGRRRPASRLALVFVRRSQAVLRQVVHRHVRFSITVAPRLAVVPQRRLTSATGTGRQPLATACPAVARIATRPGAPFLASARRDALVLRLTNRARRLEVTPQAGSHESVRHDSSALERDLAMRPAAAAGVFPLARGVPAASPRETAMRAGSGDTTAPSADRPGGRFPSGGPLHDASVSWPNGEVERLAERVIGSIDRRIAAQRERLGRF